jgi:hypothetical protein
MMKGLDKSKWCLLSSLVFLKIHIKIIIGFINVMMNNRWDELINSNLKIDVDMKIKMIYGLEIECKINK